MTASPSTYHFGIFDYDATLRARRLPAKQGEAALKGGYSFPNVLYRWDTGESVYDFTGWFGDEACAIAREVAESWIPGDPATGSRMGPVISEAAWQGKVVVLNYWATWCVPCRKEIPEFNRIHEELASKGVEVVGISMDEGGAEAVKPYLTQNPMNYTVATGTGVMEQLPVTVVLDRKGNTVQRFDGLATPAEIRAAINKAI